MRKYLIAAAAAGGMLLLGAGPAQAEDLPAPAAGQGGLLAPAGGEGGLLGGVITSDGEINPIAGLQPGDNLRLDNPLGDGAPLVDMKPGTNSVKPSIPQSQPGGRSAAPRPAEAASENGADLPLLGGSGLPTVNGLPLLGNLLPAGGGFAAERPVARESGLLEGDLPLIGSLLPDDPTRTLPASAGDPDDTSGLPQGGTDVPPSSQPSDDHKRLAEEPSDDEAGGRRAFSDGRPVAGVDPDYN